MNRFLFFALIVLCHNIICAQESQTIINPKTTAIDTFLNSYIIEDKYRWLEDVNSTETREWIDFQNKLSKKYLAKSSNKTNAYSSINKYSYTEYENPQKQGDYYFIYAYYNDLGAPALFYQTSIHSQAELLIDPNKISSKDLILLKGYYISKNSKYLAYQFSRNGSDWAEVKVINIETGIHKKDHLSGLKFSNISWLNDGFFYSTISQDGEFGMSAGQKVYYHKLGTTQEEDKLIFQRKKNPSAQFFFKTTSNQRFFLLKERDELNGKINIFYIDYQATAQHLKPLITNLSYGISIHDSHNGKFIATTTHESNNGSIVEIDPADPFKWKSIAAEYSDALLLEVIPFSDRIVAVYQSDQHPIITVINYSGEVLYHLDLPIATSVRGFSGSYTDEELLYNFSSYTIPPIVYKFNIRTFEKTLTKKTTVTFDFKKFVYEEVECLTKDSIAIPIILVYENGIELNGLNPTILKAYGGFGAVVQPGFDPGIVHFLKHGGIYAFANIRGGGDKGFAWAEAGKGENKQNSFDDFIAAAEFLIEKKYTNSEQLAITGASNGGLVVAVAAIQRPDLFKAVVPIVAPLDMLRLEKFTVGHWHIDEYGTVLDSLSFTRLLQYSPYQNIDEDINYPKMLVITSENDDRVPPFHSYKFVARLQNRDAQLNSIYLKVKEDSGHSGSSSLTSRIQGKADIYGFIMNELME